MVRKQGALLALDHVKLGDAAATIEAPHLVAPHSFAVDVTPSTCFLLRMGRYGLVNKKNAAAILDKCVLGTEGMKPNWRGNMANPGTKAESPAKPAAETPTIAKPQAESASVSEAVTAGRPRRDSQLGDGA